MKLAICTFDYSIDTEKYYYNLLKCHHHDTLCYHQDTLMKFLCERFIIYLVDKT